MRFVPKRVTLADVAARAGVHVATASLALSGSPRVNPATRASVHESARVLGYVSAASRREHFRDSGAFLSSRDSRAARIALVSTDSLDALLADTHLVGIVSGLTSTLAHARARPVFVWKCATEAGDGWPDPGQFDGAIIVHAQDADLSHCGASSELAVPTVCVGHPYGDMDGELGDRDGADQGRQAAARLLGLLSSTVDSGSARWLPSRRGPTVESMGAPARPGKGEAA